MPSDKPFDPMNAMQPAIALLQGNARVLRRCGMCHTWNSKPCGEQCGWSPSDPPFQESAPVDTLSDVLVELREAREALRRLWNETVASGNGEAHDFGWEAARLAALAVLDKPARQMSAELATLRAPLEQGLSSAELLALATCKKCGGTKPTCCRCPSTPSESEILQHVEAVARREFAVFHGCETLSFGDGCHSAYGNILGQIGAMRNGNRPKRIPTSLDQDNECFAVYKVRNGKVVVEAPPAERAPSTSASEAHSRGIPVLGAAGAGFEEEHLVDVRRALAAVEQIERHCPCGARPETPNTHHHVAGCPVEVALVYLRSALDVPEAK